MSWRPDEAYLHGLDFFDSVVERVPADGWQAPTPCADWRAVDVLGHVGAATRFGMGLLSGDAPVWRPSDKPGEAVAGEPTAWWQSISEQVRPVASRVDLTAEVDTPAGRRSVAEGLSFPAVDLFVHGWDLARSAGVDAEIPADAIKFAHSVLDRVPVEQLRRAGVFADEKSAFSQASPTEAFIAWTGRDPGWSPVR